MCLVYTIIAYVQLFRIVQCVEILSVDEDPMNKTCMSYWLPMLEKAGLPTPRTIMVPMDRETFIDIYRVFDGESPTDLSQPFFDELRKATDTIGYPCFLRTGLTSGKHNWENTCFVVDPAKLKGHVFSIVEYGELACIMGLPANWWAAREFLPTIPKGVCPEFGNMPLCREFRVFVDDGAIRCYHPYWPMRALEQGGVYDTRIFEALADETGIQDVLVVAAEAGRAIPGSWSVDLLETERGWYITDMAQAHESFHWDGCERALATA